MKNLVITIGRENGSGGRYIGELLAEKLQIKCYNDELLAEVAKESGMDIKYLHSIDEKRTSGKWFFGGQPVQDAYFREQGKIIWHIAERESCIIIGRASDYALRGYENVINVFVHAPLQERIRRVCSRKETDYEHAAQMIARQDRERANFYNFNTKQRWGDSKNYHLCLDTGVVGIQGAVDMMEHFISLRRNRLV